MSGAAQNQAENTQAVPYILKEKEVQAEVDFTSIRNVKMRVISQLYLRNQFFNRIPRGVRW